MKFRVMTVVLALAMLAGAAVIRVPGDSATIQRGLNGALSGDTVLVAPGTYYERINWPARDGIVLLSEKGADSTVIDASDSGRVVTMQMANYTPATVLEGFTITHGVLTSYPGNGAGLLCSTSPTICRNRIVNNRLYAMGYGGGVYCEAPVFHDNIVAWDTIANAGGGGWRYGPGVHCTGSGVFYQNVFMENAALGGAGGFWYGGGISLAGGEPLVFANLFVRNRIGTTTGGIAYGGGLYIGAGSAYVVNNTFFANECSTAITYGGGIYVAQSWTSVIKNNIIYGNRADGIGKMGGGIACMTDTIHDTLTFDYNDVWDNYPGDYYACYAGPNAISLDPWFVTGAHGDFYLSAVSAGQDSTSPCIDAGDTLATAPLNVDSLIHLWTTRTDSLRDDGVLDLGYHYPQEPIVGLASGALPPWSEPRLLVRPNPARSGLATLSFTGPLESSTPRPLSVSIFDPSGRAVRSSIVQGPTSVLDLRRLPAGAYVVLLEGVGFRASARCIVTE